MKDDKGVTLDFVKLNRTKEIFKYGSGKDEGAYNIKRDEMYDVKLIGLVFTKVIYFYNVNNPNPLNYEKGNIDGWKPIVSPQLYDRMLENEILIKLNTLSSSVDWKKWLIVAGIAIVLYLLWQSGIFGGHGATAILNATNSTNSPGNITGNFTRVIANNVTFPVRSV